MQHYLLLILSVAMAVVVNAQNLLPTPLSVSTQGAVLPAPGQVSVTLKGDANAPSDEMVREIAGVPLSRIFCSPHPSHLKPESYRLDLTGDNAVIEAADYRGYIYALHTLAQLLQSDSIAANITVSDSPRCGWRAFMLDSGRQMHSVDVVKKYIRMASMLKMNRFHWHLTEGLGWRPEIKALPLLSSAGGYVADGEGQQGYFSQSDMREIVDYAGRWGIEIVPEIDIPGHSEAALYAYPELGCRGVRPEIPRTGFTSDIFCAGNDSTLNALYTILDEICALFPGEYIHLGGDEAPKENWNNYPRCRARMEHEGLADSHELQLWLSTRMAAHLASKGRKAVFWEDVVNNTGPRLPDNAVIQWWNYRGHGNDAVHKAKSLGLPVVLSPNYYCYLNFPETPWRGYENDRTFDLADAYLRNPAHTEISRDNPLLMGITAALWTDYGLTDDMIDNRIFPRIFALAELMWHQGELMTLNQLTHKITGISAYFSRQGFVW